MLKSIFRGFFGVLHVFLDLIGMLVVRDASRLGHYAENAKAAMQPKVKVKLPNGKKIKVNL